MSAVRTRILDGFGDPAFGPDRWEALLASTATDNVYLTEPWQRAWWETMARGRLLLIVAERDGAVVALAPLYEQSGLVQFASTEFESDYLDFIGDVSGPGVLESLLDTARSAVSEFAGFRFYFMPDASGNGHRLENAAARLGLSCHVEDEMTAPVLDLAGAPDVAAEMANKKRLIERERRLREQGAFEVQTWQHGDAVLAQLPEFFAQHVSRHPSPKNPSRFFQEKPRMLFERFTRAAADTGWLRFMRLTLDGRPIAFHYGLCYRRRFFWGPTSFAVDLKRFSPGQVLVRQLLLGAIDEGARIFDFGTGDQDFKRRFSSRIDTIRTWGLYPSESARQRQLDEAGAVGTAER